MPKTSTLATLSILMLLIVGPTLADDVRLELGAGDDFVVEDASGNDRLRVDSSTGAVQIGTNSTLEFQTDGVCVGGTNPGVSCLSDAECVGGGSCDFLNKNAILFSKPVSLLDRDPDGDGFDNGPGDDLIGSTRLQLVHNQTQGANWLMTDNVLCLLFNYTDCYKGTRIDTSFAGAAFQMEFLFQGKEPNQTKGMELIWEGSDAAGFLDRFLLFHLDTAAPDFPLGAATFNFWANGQDSGNATLHINRRGLEVRGGYWNKVPPMSADLDQQGVATNMGLNVWDNGVATEMRTLELGHQFSPTAGEPEAEIVRVLMVATPGTTAHETVSNHAGIMIANQLGLGDAGISNALWLKPQSAAVDDDRKGNINLEGGDAGSGHITFGPAAALGHVYYDRAASNFASELGGDFTGQLCVNKSQGIAATNRSAEMCDDSAEAILSQAGDGAVSGPGFFWAASDGASFDTGTEVCRAHGLLCRSSGVYDHGNVAVNSAAAITRRACGFAVPSGNDFTVFCVGD